MVCASGRRSRRQQLGWVACELIAHFGDSDEFNERLLSWQPFECMHCYSIVLYELIVVSWKVNLFIDWWGVGKAFRSPRVSMSVRALEGKGLRRRLELSTPNWVEIQSVADHHRHALTLRSKGGQEALVRMSIRLRIF